MPPVLSNAVLADGLRLTWEERLQRANERFGSPPASRVVYVVDNATEALEALIFGLHWDLDFGILETSRLSGAAVERLDSLGIARFRAGSGAVEGPAGVQPARPGRISVMTSGTTGLFKSIEHTWQTLNTLARVREDQARFWFVPYQIGSYAWYQMVCLGLFRPGQDLFCGSSAEPVASFAQALEAGVTAVSSTPTFWRYVFLSLDEDLIRNSKLTSVSMGGEIVDQGILDQLADVLPQATVRHIYASSEAGAAIVVTDGKAGFPVSRLTEDAAATVGLRVQDGRLYVRSPFTTSAAGGEDTWVDTGDLVEVRGDRVYFLGREETSMINVGGMKAFPADIEAHLLKHPNVLWAQVYARRAPMVGSLPAARVVLRTPSEDASQDEMELAQFAAESLPEHAVPRFWEIRTEIPLKPSLKS